MKMLDQAIRCFQDRNGVLTEKLKLNRGKFGLGLVPEKGVPDEVMTSVCGFCSTGCNLKIHLKKGKAVNLSPEFRYPVNMGMACPKGWESLAVLNSDDRATVPKLKDSEGNWDEVSWERATSEFVSRIKDIQSKYGKESVAFLSTGQIVNEEMALLGVLTKFGMGILHGDGNTRQCMATAVTAYKESFGFDAPPYTYKDFEASDVLIFVGANPCIAHPIMWQRVMMNPNAPKIVVVDPRKTETAMAATHHYPIRPKSDLVFFYAVAKALIDAGFIDESFIDKSTEGFDEFREFLSEFSLERASELSGIEITYIQELVQLIGKGKRVSIWWTMGVNQSYEGVRLAQSLINIALITGNIGRPGTGANSITGQCNAMGSRLFSNTTSLFAGRDFENSEDRKDISDKLSVPFESIPCENSLAYDQILQGVEEGKIKALWVIATNTGHSWINQNRFRELRNKLEFLVVQDMYESTETALIADLILPAAGWGEKEGTFINSERRIGRVQKVQNAPGLAKSDFEIFRLIGEKWGCASWFDQWKTPEAVFDLLKGMTVGRPCDISGIQSYDYLEALGGIQWPFLGSENLSPERRLFEDGKFYRTNGKALFCFEPPKKRPEEVTAEFPYVLLTGRGTSAQWHTQTRTAKSSVLRKLYPEEAYIEINKLDAEKIGVNSGSQLKISSLRGEVIVKAVITVSVRTGTTFMPMHYRETNYLTRSDFDPYSRQPSYKYSTIRIEKI